MSVRNGAAVREGDGRHWSARRDEELQEYVNRRTSEEVASRTVRPKTRNQGLYLDSMRDKIITMCHGPAGTGKTYMACGVAAQMMRAGKVARIVLTRPLLECDEELGFLPGGMGEKVAPMMRPFFDAFGDFFTPPELVDLVNKDRLEICPLAYMRGRTFRDAYCILDEAQNATRRQLKLFLTRFGGGYPRVVVCGDHTQSDLPVDLDGNPLLYAVDRLWGDPDIGVVRFDAGDIVRHGLIQRIISRWDD